MRVELGFSRSAPADHTAGIEQYKFSFRDALGSVDVSVAINGQFMEHGISPRETILNEVRNELEKRGFGRERWQAVEPLLAYALLLEYPQG